MSQRWRFEQESRPGSGGENQDAVFCAPVGNLLFAAVADGVGGRPNGAWAAQRAVHLAVRRAKIVRGADALDPGVWRMALQELHGRLGRERDGSTTLTIVITDGARWTAAWIGDTRLYLVTGAGIENVTETRDRTGYLGGDEAPIAHGKTGVLNAGERLVLLSDGLWKFVPGDAFRALLAGASGQVLVAMLAEVQRRNSGKLPDDASGVVIEAAAPPVAQVESPEDAVVWIEEEGAPTEEPVYSEMNDTAVVGAAVSIREVLGEDVARRPAPVAPRAPARDLARERLTPMGKLGLDPFAAGRLAQALAGKRGLVVLAGAAQTGKTTTGYALCETLARDGVVVSVESPLERMVPGLVQVNCAWNEMEKQMRAAAERVDLRALHAKIEWYEMALVMLRAAEAGRIALGALPVESAARAIERLIQLGLDAERLAAELRAVHAQVLLPHLCLGCREPRLLEPADLERIGLDEALKEKLQMGFLDLERVRVYKPRGCRACKNTGLSQTTGFGARVVASETLVVDDAVRAAIRRGAPAAELERVAQASGMWSLRESALRRVLLGEVALEDVERVIA